MAELVTAIPVRQRPTGPVETFSTERSDDTVACAISTEDIALLLLRFANGARGSVAISQVSSGRKNSLQYEVDGSAAAASWDSETPDHMCIGHRDRPNEILQRSPALMNSTGGAAASLPGGHVEEFADTFHALFRAIYDAVSRGRLPQHPHLRIVRRWPPGDAHRRRRPPLGTRGALDRRGGLRSMKLGLLTAPFPETTLAEVARWSAANGFESLEIGMLAARHRTDPTLCRYVPYRRRQPVRGAVAGHPGRNRKATAWASPGWASIPTRCIPIRPPGTGHRPPQAGHTGGPEDGRWPREHVHGWGRQQDTGCQLGGCPPGLARHRRLRTRPWRAADHRELSHQSSPATSGRAATTSPGARASGAGSWSNGRTPSASITIRHIWSG